MPPRRSASATKASPKRTPSAKRPAAKAAAAVAATSSSSPSAASASSSSPARAKTPEYVAPQFSILMEFVLNPFYTWIAQFYPSWWSPNGITLFGITCTVLGSLLFMTDAIFPVTNDATTGLPRTGAGFEFLWDLRPTSTESFNQAHGIVAAAQQQPAAASKQSATGANKDAPTPTPAPAAPAAASSSNTGGKFELPTILATPQTLPANSFVDWTPSNAWVFILCGVLNIIYTICDNTDGKHARRFKMSSAIGEYLDHGLDSVTALLSCFVVGAAAGERIAIGFALQLGSALMMCFCHFHHWDKNQFIWGDRIFSVDEAMVLISVFPLVVGIFPAVQTLMLYGTNVRFVQVMVLIFIFAVFPNAFAFIYRNKRVINTLFFFEVTLIAAMVFWAVFHQGGMSSDVTIDYRFVRDLLSPYLSWNGEAVFTFPENTAPGAPAVPQVVKTLYNSIILLCPPYLLRVIGSRLVKLLTCYPACWAITMACSVSTLVHIPIFAKCIKSKTLSYTNLLGSLLAVWMFGVSPSMGMIVSVVWHLGQIVCNCAALQRARG